MASHNSNPPFPRSLGAFLTQRMPKAAEQPLALLSHSQPGWPSALTPMQHFKRLNFCSSAECKRLSTSPFKKQKIQCLYSPFFFKEHSEKREGLPLFSPGKSNPELCKNASKKRTFLPINAHLMNKRETIEVCSNRTIMCCCAFQLATH